MTQAASGQNLPKDKDKMVYLRQWVGEKVNVVTSEKWQYSGILSNIVFDGQRLMYIMLDDRQCLNFDHIVEISKI